MRKYIGTKTIDAERMSECEFLEKTKGMDTRNREDQPGYRVVYPDGYVSWSPKGVFDKAYHEVLFETYPLPDNADQEEHRIPAIVYPSGERTIAVAPDPDYGGAHRYQFINSLGFKDGQTQYEGSFQQIQFVQKNADGTMTPGLQSEQLLLVLIDRHRKLNDKFPSREGSLAITKMEEVLHWLEARVRERISRGVMGDLKK